MLSTTCSLSVLVALGSIAAAAAPEAAPPPVIWNNPQSQPPGIEHGSFRSRAAGAEVGYTVALPPGYTTSAQRYPVIYYLHGWGGNENSDAASFSSAVMKAVEEARMPASICVFPNGGQSAYRNDPAGGVQGEALIVNELVPLIDRTYRTVAARDARTMVGFSMGGAGAICLALKHPDLFSAAAAWAAAFEMPQAGGVGGEVEEAYLRGIRGRVRLMMVVGTEDMTFRSHERVVHNLVEAGYPFNYRVLAGVDHNLGIYRQRTTDEVLRFLAGRDP